MTIDMPEPADHDQEGLLRIIWHLFKTNLAWPSFLDVEQAMDRKPGYGDALEAWKAMPAELIYPSAPHIAPPDDQPMKLTLAAAIWCGLRPEIVHLFVGVLLLADQTRKAWNGKDSPGPTFTSADVAALAGPGAAADVVPMIRELLQVEPWGNGGSSIGDDHWQFVVGRGIRIFRGVQGVSDYWDRRMVSIAPPPRSLSWSDASPQFPAQVPSDGEVSVEINSDVVQPARPPGRKVFLVHGRDMVAKAAVVELLEAFDLTVVTWNDAVGATGLATPYTGDVVRKGMAISDAVVVLFTPDDVARVHPDFLQPRDGQSEREVTGQARLNVVFEAGMAMAIDRDHVVLIEVGIVREMSDTAGLNVCRLHDDVDSRRDLATRLGNAQLAVRDLGRDHRWQTAGNLAPAWQPRSAASSFNSAPDPARSGGRSQTAAVASAQLADDWSDRVQELLSEMLLTDQAPERGRDDASGQPTGRLYMLAQPVDAAEDVALALTRSLDQSAFIQFVREGVQDIDSRSEAMVELSYMLHRSPTADGVALRSDPIDFHQHEDLRVDLEIREDGGLRLLAGGLFSNYVHGSGNFDSGTITQLTAGPPNLRVKTSALVGYTHCLINWAAAVGTSVGYTGNWIFGVRLTGTAGARAAISGPRHLTFQRDLTPYSNDSYSKSAAASANRLSEERSALAYMLIGKYLRSLGADHIHPELLTFA